MQPPALDAVAGDRVACAALHGRGQCLCLAAGAGAGAMTSGALMLGCWSAGRWTASGHAAACP